jgi:hypothetical protein
MLTMLVMDVQVLVFYRRMRMHVRVALSEHEPRGHRVRTIPSGNGAVAGSPSSATASAAPKNGAVPKCAAVLALPRCASALTNSTRLSPWLNAPISMRSANPLAASFPLIVPSPLGMVEMVLPLQYLSTAKLAEFMNAVGSVDGQP